MTTSLLVSVRSDLASKIISGEKPLEMRKSAPKTQPDYLIVYAKKPTGMAIGYCKVSKISFFRQDKVEAKSDRIFVEGMYVIHFVSEFLGRVLVTSEEFNRYFGYSDYKKGFVIALKDPIAIEPVKLPFQPPQQWRYFDGHPEEVITGWRGK